MRTFTIGAQPKRNWARTSRHARHLFVLLFVTLAVPAWPQEARWRELNEQASKLRDEGKFADAIRPAEESIRVAETTFGAEHPNAAESLNNLGLLYKRLGRYAEAEPLYRRALAILEKTFGPEHPNVAACLGNLAELYRAQAKYAEAEPLYKRSLAIMEKVLGPDDPDVATSLNNLAALYYEQGRYTDAEPLFQRAVAIQEKASGPDNPIVATSLNNLGALYKEQGRYGEAEPVYKRALAIREKLGPENLDTAQSLNNLGTLYKEEGRHGEAEPLYRRALAIRETQLGPEHPSVANSLNNLAALYDDQRRYDQAERLYKRALAIQEKALGPNHPAVATSLNNLALLYKQQGHYAEAEPLYNRALAIREKALGRDHPLVATDLNNLGALYEAETRYDEAEQFYKRALAIFEKALGANHPDIGTSLNNLALLSEARGDPSQAAQYFDRELSVLAGQFDYYFSFMSEKERLQFLGTTAYRFPLYFSFCFSYRQQLPELAGKMYDLVLWEKGFIAQSAAALRAKIRASGDAQSLRTLDELAAKKSELAKLAGAQPGTSAEKQAARRQRIEQLEKEANELEKDLVRRSGALMEEKRLARVTWQQVRDTLKPDEAAVEIVRFLFYDGKNWTDTNYYVALIVTPQSRQPAFVVLGEQKNLEGAPLDDYRQLVAGPDADDPQKAGAGSKFYAAFWQPLEAPLGSAKHVYVSPDGALSQVSLGVAPRTNDSALMDAYDLRMVTSTKELLRHAVKSAANAALLVGNPNFDLSEMEQRAALQTSQPQAVQVATAAVSAVADSGSGNSLRSRDLRSGQLEPLAGTQQEVEDVSRLLLRENWQVQSYTEAQALEERVKAAHAPRVLHLATHGFFEADQQVKHAERGSLQEQQKDPGLEDPMLRSGVYLAGANRILKGEARAADMDDGILTAFEATQLNLQGTELVVLSACETGLGKSQAGEGVFGLQRGLQEAGAQAVVMSMWSVPDQETRELMTLFYRKWLAGAEKHEALRQAQQEVRARIRARDGRDEPFFWGAFVLVGR